jgi:hypothetical protein
MTAEPERAKAQFDSMRAECDGCGRNDWWIAKDRFALSTIDESNRLAGTGMPVNAVICRWCGFVRLFHANPAEIDT